MHLKGFCVEIVDKKRGAAAKSWVQWRIKPLAVNSKNNFLRILPAPDGRNFVVQ
jgi:hypothetical protein